MNRQKTALAVRASMEFTKTKNGVLERRYATHYIAIKEKDDE